jgi:hypothetical protein
MESSFQQAHKIGTIHTLLGLHEDLMEFFFPRNKKPPPSISKLLHSTEITDVKKRLYVQLAFDFWSGAGRTQFADLVDIFEDEDWLILIRTIGHFKELPEIER